MQQRQPGAVAYGEYVLKPTDIANPDYFHKVVDCQWACPAHTAVPEYIRLIAAGRYGDTPARTAGRTCARGSRGRRSTSS